MNENPTLFVAIGYLVLWPLCKEGSLVHVSLPAYLYVIYTYDHLAVVLVKEITCLQAK